VKVALVTDSNAQMPPLLVDRFGVEVVPLVVTIDGVEYFERVDLDDAEFYDRLTAGAKVSTAAPAPGSFVAAYERAADSGADAVLSIHIGSNTSATLNSATIAAGMSPIPVTHVDTGTASFAVGCCVWAAGEVVARGGSLEDARDAAERVSRSIGNVFIIGALGLARAGGRLASDAQVGDGAPVLALEGGQMRPLARVASDEEAVEAMASYVEARADGRAQRIGVGDARTEDLALALIARLERGRCVGELVRYAIGPSVGAHTGSGSVGAVFFPLD
jgi:DegV family protein with EDD domain